MGVFVRVHDGRQRAVTPDPAVTLGAWRSPASSPGRTCPIYMAGQLIGAMIGSQQLWLAYLPPWAETADTDAKRGVFCARLAIHGGRRKPACCAAIGTRWGALAGHVRLKQAVMQPNAAVLAGYGGSRADPRGTAGVGDRPGGWPRPLRDQPGTDRPADHARRAPSPAKAATTSGLLGCGQSARCSARRSGGDLSRRWGSEFAGLNRSGVDVIASLSGHRNER